MNGTTYRITEDEKKEFFPICREISVKKQDCENCFITED